MIVGVIGAGQMGAGIAQVSAGAGHDVLLSDIDLARAEAGKAGSRRGSAASSPRKRSARATPTRCSPASRRSPITAPSPPPIW
jgi:3-hydroxybutyryl-CoA dehydrogenase